MQAANAVDVSDEPPTAETLVDESQLLADDDEDDDDDTQWESEAAAMATQFESLVSLAPLGGGSSGGGGGGGQKLSQAAGSSLRSIDRKAARGKEHTGLTRDERATVEQVLDPRTRLLLFKLINTGTLESINGCVSTGKEANVYHAFGASAASRRPPPGTAMLMATGLRNVVRVRGRAGRQRVRGQGVQDLDPRLPRPRPVRLRRVPVPPWLLQGESSEDGQNVVSDTWLRGKAPCR